MRNPSNFMQDPTRSRHFSILKPDIVQAVVAAYESGRSSADVGREYTISSQTVLHHVRCAGKQVRLPRRYHYLSDEEKLAIEQVYQIGGTTLDTLAARFDVNMQTVRAHIKSKGLTIGVGSSNKRRALPQEDATVNSVVRTYRRGAIQRGLTFDITRDQIRDIMFQPCNYCGRTRVNPGGGYPYNGLDRRDNSLGYTLQNTVSCCGMCNRVKSDLSEEDFLKWVGYVYQTRVAHLTPVTTTKPDPFQAGLMRESEGVHEHEE